MLTQPDLFQPGHRPDIPGQLRKTARTIRNCPACPGQPESGGIAGVAVNVRDMSGMSGPCSGLTDIPPLGGDVRGTGVSCPVSEEAPVCPDRKARAEDWRRDQEERAAICAGLPWQDCVRALVAAKGMSPALAGFMGVDL